MFCWKIMWFGCNAYAKFVGNYRSCRRLKMMNDKYFVGNTCSMKFGWDAYTKFVGNCRKFKLIVGTL